METLTLVPQSASSIRKAIRPAVYVDGARRHDLAVLKWEWLPAPRFGSAQIALHRPAPYAPTRIEDAAILPPVGSRVRIRQDDLTEFTGWVTQHHLAVSPEGETLLAQVEHQLAADLATPISGLWHQAGDNKLYADGIHVCFNGRGMLASDDTVGLNLRQCRLFSAGADAQSWTVADALAYLLAAYVTPEVSAPSLAELRGLSRLAPLGPMDVTGMTAGEALMRIADIAGLDIRPAAIGRGIVFYRPGKCSPRASVRLAPAGSESPSGSNLMRASIRTGPSARPAVLALGQPKRHETTLELRPGWDPARQTPRWRDFVRSLSDDWIGQADVYRKWVLNEHGWYSGSPWNLPLGQLAFLGAGDFTLCQPRRFEPCLSRGPDGRSMGILVEVRLGAGQPWRQWRGPALVSPDECAVYLGGDGLPADYFRAAVQGSVALRVTASVDADARLSANIPGDGGAGLVLLDAPHTAWRRVHSSSVLAGASGLSQPAEQDDTDALTELAQQRSARISASSAELTLPAVEICWQVGDSIERIDGRAVELTSGTSRRPFVTSVVYDFQNQTTHLTVQG